MCSTPLLSLTAKHHLHEARSIVCTHGLEILQTWATYQVIESYIVATRLGQKWQNATLPPGLKRCQRLCVWDLGHRAIHAVAAIKELSVGVFISPKRDLDARQTEDLWYCRMQTHTVQTYIHCFFLLFSVHIPRLFIFFLCVSSIPWICRGKNDLKIQSLFKTINWILS